jgi:hypothetical protein
MVLASSAIGGNRPQPPMQHGRVLSQDYSSQAAGVYTAPIGTAVASVPLYRTTNDVVISTDRYIYQWREIGRNRLILPVNGEVDFWQEKNLFIVLDNNAKKHKFALMGTIEKSPEPTADSRITQQLDTAFKPQPVVHDTPAAIPQSQMTETVSVAPPKQADIISSPIQTAQTAMPELIRSPGMRQVQFAEAIQSLAKKWNQMPEGYRARCSDAKTVPDLEKCIVTQQETFLRMNPNVKLENNPWLYALEGPER